MNQILAITKKELRGYFGSLLAPIFLGTFLFAILFIFFSIERFFGRGIADVRPMFQWMPVLLIFLIAALTMRQWSEEQHSGTMEVLLTLPTPHWKLVLGKFLATMAMIVIALGLTLPLPILVSLLGKLDWGPVIGGYLASILMAAAYAAIGLFISSRTDNQIVALIVSVLANGLFYLLGSDALTSLFSGSLVEILRALGTGSRFESIERGVIDLRDLIYYLSLAAIFLLMNSVAIDSQRWSRMQKAYRANQLRTSSLLLLNLILVNVWLYPLNGLRLDLTAQKDFTISATTKDLVGNLQEPLLIRAYISQKTHPLLSPLIPQIGDMLREYEIAGGGKISSEVIDPLQDAELETEANQTYGISPTPFQIAGRNESSIVNAYFDILVRYGDQSIVLGLQDLIDVNSTATDVDVQLKNLEYSLTAAIKKVVYGFQSIDAVLAAVEQPVQLSLFISQALLPQNEIEIANMVIQVSNTIQEQSNGKLTFQIIDPDTATAALDRQQLIEQYNIQPYPVTLFSNDSYFFHLLLQNGEQNQIIYPPTSANEAEIRTAIESALKRTTSGFLKVAGVWIPPQTPTQDMFGNMQQPLSSYQLIAQQLQENYEIQQIDLASGRVPDAIDVLVILAPQNLSEVEQFAIDQYLMRGGALMIALSPYKLDADPINGFLLMTPIETGLTSLLASYGIQINNELILDTQNAPFPVVVTRDLGGSQIQEIQAVEYPFFIDVRQDGMNADHPIVSDLTAVNMYWASPIVIDEAANQARATTVLLSSSPNSWLSADTNIQPDFETYPEIGFAPGANQQSYPLGAVIEGQFQSYFAGKQIPVIESQNQDGTISSQPAASAIIEQSPASARMIIYSSSTFMDDFPLQLSSRLSQEAITNNLLLLQNSVDWALADTDLLSIRSRGNALRVLRVLSDQQKTAWEIASYIISALLLVAIYTFWQMHTRKVKPLFLPEQSSRQSRKEGEHE